MGGQYCNMSCHYCYENPTSKKNGKLSSESLILFLEKFQNASYISLIFHGGEPLLADVYEVEKIFQFLSTKFRPNYEVQIQTNGTIINDHWIKVFKKLNVKLVVSISIDPIGDKDLRSSNYSNYRQIVLTNIKRLQQENIAISIMSVAHKYNHLAFIDFIDCLLENKIKYLTINKFETDNFKDDAFISEDDYNSLLITVSRYWIKNHLFDQLEIQPLMSLFSFNKNKLCQYLCNEKKCELFVTLYPDKIIGCDHLHDKDRVIQPSCSDCKIYSWCGGGVLIEQKRR